MQLRVLLVRMLVLLLLRVLPVAAAASNGCGCCCPQVLHPPDTHCSMLALLLKLYPAQAAIMMEIVSMNMATVRTYRAPDV
jgi:hypothetical protein